jgi:hypothetical protein
MTAGRKILAHSFMTLTNEDQTHKRVRGGKHLSGRLPIRNGLKLGDALSPLLFNFALEYTISRVQIHQAGLKLNSTHQLLVYADDVNLLGGSVHNIKNAEALVVDSKEI